MTMSFDDWAKPSRFAAREYLARWLMEFGDGPTTPLMMHNNNWYRDIARWHPNELKPYMRRSDEKLAYYVTQEGFDLLKGASDD